MRWEMYKYYYPNNSNIKNWLNKKKCYKCAQKFPVFQTLTKMMTVPMASTPVTLLFISLLTMIPSVQGIQLVNICLPTCGPIMGGVVMAVIRLAILPSGSGLNMQNEDVEVGQPDLQQLPIEELATLIEENSDEEEDDFETSLVTNDLDHTVITHFKVYQFGPRKGKGRWIINILVGPYTYGTKRIHASEGKFHCQKCLSGFGEALSKLTNQQF